MSKFKVGEIAVLIPKVGKATSKFYPEMIGEEVEIVRASVIGFNRHYDYEIKHQSGRRFYCDEHELRKKQPPKEELSTWDKVADECGGYKPEYIPNRDKEVV